MTALLLSVRAPSGCGVGDCLEVAVPGGGVCVVLCPVVERTRFQILIPSHTIEEFGDALSPVARLRGELEGSSSDESETNHKLSQAHALSIDGIIGDEQRMPYLLDFLHKQGGQACRLLFLLLACDQHLKPRTGRNAEVRRMLRAHERSVFATYVAVDAPKHACNSLRWNIVAQLAARDACRASPELDALSDLRSEALSELVGRWDELFRASDAYKALLRDAINERNSMLPPPQWYDALDNRVTSRTCAECRHFIAMLRTFIRSTFPKLNNSAMKAKTAMRAFRWWVRLAGRLRSLCDRSKIGSACSRFDAALLQHVASSDFTLYSSSPEVCSIFKIMGGNTSPTSDVEQAFVKQIRSELRGSAHRFLVRPPTHEHRPIVDTITLEKLSDLLRRERSAFNLDTAAAMYSSLFNDCAKQLEFWLNLHVFTPFESSLLAGELAITEIDGNRMKKLRSGGPSILPRVFVQAGMQKGRLLRSGALLVHEKLVTNHGENYSQHVPDEEVMTWLDATIVVATTSPGSNAPEKHQDRTKNNRCALDLFCSRLDVDDIPALIVVLLLDMPIMVLGLHSLDTARFVVSLGNTIFSLLTMPLSQRRWRMHGPVDIGMGYGFIVTAGTDSFGKGHEQDKYTIINGAEMLPASSLPVPPVKASRTLVNELRAVQVTAISLRDGVEDKTKWRAPTQIAADESNSSDSDSSVDCNQGGESSPLSLNYSTLSIAVRNFIDAVVQMPLRLFTISNGTHTSGSNAIFHVGWFLERQKQDIGFYTSLFSTKVFQTALGNWPWAKHPACTRRGNFDCPTAHALAAHPASTHLLPLVHPNPA